MQEGPVHCVHTAGPSTSRGRAHRMLCVTHRLLSLRAMTNICVVGISLCLVCDRNETSFLSRLLLTSLLDFTTFLSYSAPLLFPTPIPSQSPKCSSLHCPVELSAMMALFFICIIQHDSHTWPSSTWNVANAVEELDFNPYLTLMNLN